jgi:THO complex subunit 1
VSCVAEMNFICIFFSDLLRRLSRSQNTVFCGRILLFLAKFFPFSERSGLNVVSEFNLDNLTTFGAKDESYAADISANSEKHKDAMEVEERYIYLIDKLLQYFSKFSCFVV